MKTFRKYCELDEYSNEVIKERFISLSDINYSRTAFRARIIRPHPITGKPWCIWSKSYKQKAIAKKWSDVYLNRLRKLNEKGKMWEAGRIEASIEKEADRTERYLKRAIENYLKFHTYQDLKTMMPQSCAGKGKTS